MLSSYAYIYQALQQRQEQTFLGHRLLVMAVKDGPAISVPMLRLSGIDLIQHMSASSIPYLQAALQ